MLDQRSLLRSAEDVQEELNLLRRQVMSVMNPEERLPFLTTSVAAWGGNSLSEQGWIEDGLLPQEVAPYADGVLAHGMTEIFAIGPVHQLWFCRAAQPPNSGHSMK